MQLRAILPHKRIKWALLTLLFIVSQFGPLSLLVGSARAAGTITVDTHEGQQKNAGVPGGYSTGNITTYSELDTINYRFNIVSSGATSGQW